MGKTYREVLLRASSFLEEAGKDGYDIQFLFLERKGWSKTDWLLNMNQEIAEEDQTQIKQDLASLMENYPPQYLLGYADFYGRDFKVTTDTLIPRPETEELVELCLNENPEKNLQVVDIGTGTGAIAITLKLEQPTWSVAASDISRGALMVAQENAASLKAEIDFREGSVLSAFPEQTFDIIISNPPYISADEWELMDESVRTFEPKTALFAEEQGLAIYRQIAQEAKKHLKPTGNIYLEIGFRQAQAVKEIFAEAFPEKRIEVHQDLAGNDRMIVVHS